MKKYLNLSGKSAIAAYIIEPTRIIIWFHGNRAYSYSERSAGKMNVEVMKMLARNGKGLNSFINRNVRSRYERPV